MPDPLPCVAENEAVLSFDYQVVGEELASLSYEYAVTPSTEEYASLTYGYEIAIEGLTSWEPTETPVGYMTQVIGNFFPYWHGANAKQGGRTQRVLNSLAGYHLTEVLTGIRKLRANLFLSTASVSEPYKIWVAPRPIAFGDHQPSSNLLQNPSLNRHQPKRHGPWGWNSGLLGSTGTWTMERGKGLFGYYAVRMTTTEGQSVTLGQENKLIFRAGQSYTATVWYAGMRPNRDVEILNPSSGPRLQISTQYSDGTVDVTHKFLKDDTGGAWTKTSLTFTAIKDTHSIEVAVIVEPYGNESVTIEVGGFQLEDGSTSTPFSENIFDFMSLYLVSPKEDYEEETAFGDISYSRQTRVKLFEGLDYDRLLEAQPNRCTVALSTDEESSGAIQRNLLDAVVESGGDRFVVGWRIANNLIERYNADLRQNEIWGYYKIADLFGDGGRELLYFRPADLGVETTYEAITVAGDYLYVVVKETFNNKTHRVLKICSPYIRWEDTNHLECLSDIYIDDGDGDCTEVACLEGRSDKIVLTIDNVDYTATLIWDSVAGTSDGSLIFRTDPGEAVVVA